MKLKHGEADKHSEERSTSHTPEEQEFDNSVPQAWSSDWLAHISMIFIS